ncbi:MAG: hypothetical protein ACRCWD_02650 [Culicoidibacterales bacterium]
MQFWVLQREINKAILYGSAIFLLVALVLNGLFLYLDNPTAMVFLVAIVALWLVTPVLLMPTMAIRVIRFMHRIGSPMKTSVFFGQLTLFFASLYAVISIVVGASVFLNASWIPTYFAEYFDVTIMQQMGNPFAWPLALILIILSAIIVTWLTTIVYMLFRSQLLARLNWWKKLSLLVIGATITFFIISQIFQLIATLFPTLPIIPVPIATESVVNGEFLTALIQAVLQAMYIYVLVRVNTYVYQTLYESEY